jgi:hypothetical protein
VSNPTRLETACFKTIKGNHSYQKLEKEPILTCKGTVSRDLGIFEWIYIGWASFKGPPLIFLKFLCCVVIEFFNLKDPMQLTPKTDLFPVQIGTPLANTS